MLLQDGGGGGKPTKWDKAARKLPEYKNQGKPAPSGAPFFKPSKTRSLPGVTPNDWVNPGPASRPTTQVEEDIFTRLGWRAPKAEKKPEAVFDLQETRDLSLFSYTISPKEWDRIKSETQHAPGYGNPDRQTLDVFGSSPVENALGIAPLDLNPKSAEKPKNLKPGDKDFPKTEVTTKEAVLSWDAYNALTPAQQAAVDFNSLLVNARETDLSHSYAPDAERRAAYDKRVSNLFGPGGGSETYAPETVSLLSQVGADLIGQDLDEYLSLERAIDLTEIKDFDLSKIKALTLGPGGSPNPTTGLPVDTTPVYREVRTSENLKNIDAEVINRAKTTIDNAMRDAYAALATFETTLAAGRYEESRTLGGGLSDLSGMRLAQGASIPADTPTSKMWWVPTEAWGFPTKNVNSLDKNSPVGSQQLWFQEAYKKLQDPSVYDTGWLWDELNTVGATDEDVEMFLDYVSTRSYNEDRWGDSGGKGDRSPQEVRRFLGIEG